MTTEKYQTILNIDSEISQICDIHREQASALLDGLTKARLVIYHSNSNKTITFKFFWPNATELMFEVKRSKAGQFKMNIIHAPQPRVEVTDIDEDGCDTPEKDAMRLIGRFATPGDSFRKVMFSFGSQCLSLCYPYFEELQELL